ncbi:MAG: hypothetical protein EOM54_01570 [Clostridia bacterium]|nr:hypothetical protein [Clostridia bacterium]
MKKKSIPASLIISIVLLSLVMAAGVFGLRAADEARGAESVRVLEDSIRRAAVSCYAIEGRYPDRLQYLEENYGVYVDEEEYAVFYEVFATNIMPDVTVIEKP